MLDDWADSYAFGWLENFEFRNTFFDADPPAQRLIRKQGITRVRWVDNPRRLELSEAHTKKKQ
jgi:hypothetical protein